MSKKANPAAIGAFVVIAVALTAFAVAIFGGSELLKRKVRYITYFDSSVKGLRVGSNVLFKGVRIGYVTDISLIGDADSLVFLTPVTMEILPEALTVTREGQVLGDTERQRVSMQDLVVGGLRAQLGTESFVTGQLVVELDFRPEMPAVFRGTDPPYPEIPSVQSNIQQLVESVQRWFAEFTDTVDISKLSADIQGLISGLDSLINSPDLRASLAGISQLVNDPDTRLLGKDLRAAIADFRSTLNDTRQLVRNADAGLAPVLRDLGPALDRLDTTLAAGEEVLRNASDQIRGDTELGYQLTGTLSEIKSAARTLRIFLDYLERNPEALLRGKQESKE